MTKIKKLLKIAEEIIEKIEKAEKQMPTLFEKDIKKGEEVIGRVSGEFTKDETICLQSFIALSQKIWHVRITSEEEGRIYHIRDASYLEAFEVPLPCAKKFKIEIMTSDNKKIIFELNKEEVFKEAI